ncbi:hypothetical protein JKF63_03588 [Porcisia hertigi]|uniref:Uncharacterized protein n=1 Tax=Porcisia hertigi TaxID=2761500 RepID=A0A836L6U6_9TRYP|nr:hypothetical protein JKF63_03588 [Porcisia hertigi]
MGGAPSRETLVRHIVRSPCAGGGSTVSTAGRCAAGDLANASDSSIHAPTATPQQSEIILIPLITDYFFSCTCPLFRQLLSVRREPHVAYYYRDARSTASEQTVVQDHIGSDKDLYDLYMSLSEQRLVETDNELIALSRAGRVVSPVPCAVAFVYHASNTIASAATTADAGATTTDASTSNTTGGGTKKCSAKGYAYRHGRASGTSASNEYMTIENTVRLPNVNLRVRIFGFIGDTRFCPASMQLSQAIKLPICLTIYLSKSAGGNHRAQVTLLAAHTYIAQMQALGILRPHDQALRLSGAVMQRSMVQRDLNTNTAGSDTDPLAALRFGEAGSAADAYRDPYTDPYDDDLSAARDPYDNTDGHRDDEKRQSPLAMAHVAPGGGSAMYLKGLGTTPTLAAEDVVKEPALRRPIEIFIHRADVPALCYLRELRALMGQKPTEAAALAPEKTAQERTSSFHESFAAPPTATALLSLDDRNEEEVVGDVHVASAKGNTSSQVCCAVTRSCRVTATHSHASISAVETHSGCGGVGVDTESLRHRIQTVICAEELRGSVASDSAGHILLWASGFYTNHFKQLVGSEAAKLRRELAKRNMTESPLDGMLSLADEEPRLPKVTPKVGDVWIPPCEAYVDAHGADDGGRDWAKVAAGTVLRYVRPPASAPSDPASGGFWRVSSNEFAEDILLSLCRQACQASRRASPTDSHWLVNRKTGALEGLGMGFLIWRELCSGQVVLYGTTPEFLKKWIQSGADVAEAYRNHVDQLPQGNKERTAAETMPGDATFERDGDAEAERRSFSKATAITTAVSCGLRGFNKRNPSPDMSSASSVDSRSGRSDGRRSEESHPSSMALYSAHGGFISARAQAMSISLPETSKERGNHADNGSTPKRVCTDDPTHASSLVTSSIVVNSLAQPRGSPEASHGETGLRQSSSASVEHLRFSIPAAPRSLIYARTPSLSALGTPKSYSKMSLSATSTGSQSSASISCRPPSRHMLLPSDTSGFWIGPPSASPAADTDAPPLNVVVRQRHKTSRTPLASATYSAPSLCASELHSRSPYFRTPRGVPSMLPAGAQSNLTGSYFGAFSEYSAQVTTDTVDSQARGSMPVRVSATWKSSSEGGSFQQGGHSPTSVKQSRSLLCTDGALLSRSRSWHGAAGLGDAPRPPARRSAAIVVESGDRTGIMPGSSFQAATSAKWTTTSTAQPSSMRGASITFASGSASSAHSRHAFLVHSSRCAEPRQPVAGGSSSLSAAEPLESRICANGSQRRGEESLCPPPTLSTAGSDARGANVLVQSLARQSGAGAVREDCGDVFTAGTPCCTPAVATVRMPVSPHSGGVETGALRSDDSNTVHTPRPCEVVNSAKSSVGSGKYRWDWRGISWTA